MNMPLSPPLRTDNENKNGVEGCTHRLQEWTHQELGKDITCPKSPMVAKLTLGRDTRVQVRTPQIDSEAPNFKINKRSCFCAADNLPSYSEVVGNRVLSFHTSASVVPRLALSHEWYKQCCWSPSHEHQLEHWKKIFYSSIFPYWKLRYITR